MEGIFDFLTELLYGNFWLATFSALAWGMLSILLSPCHLSSIPLIVGFLSSQREITIKKAFSLSFFFAIGILITIAIIGGVTLALGRLMGDIGTIGNYIVAIVFFAVGFYLLDVVQIPWGGAGLLKAKFSGLLAALVLGLIFGVGLGPCTFAFMAPILGIVFQVSDTNLTLGVSLLVAFSIGHIFLIVVAGTLTKGVQRYLHWTENSKATKYLRRVCGVLVILGAMYLIYTTF